MSHPLMWCPMNIRLLLDLIRYHYQRNNLEFDRAASDVADSFRRENKHDIADYILAQMSSQSLTPQSASVSTIRSEEEVVGIPKIQRLSNAFVEVVLSPTSIPLPQILSNSVNGIRHAIDTRKMLSKFLFVGAPGTGKTEVVKQLAFALGRKLYSVNFNQLIDSRMGQTAKNIEDLFQEISSISVPNSCLFLFDEIDGIALTRTDNNDIREMGRATTAFIRGMDSLGTGIVIFATTNLGEKIDSALRRRFDYTLNFDCYKSEDLIESAWFILSSFLDASERTDVVRRVAKKIFESSHLEAPGIMRNQIRTAVAFSDPNRSFSFLKALYKEFQGREPEIEILSRQGFSLREIELITSKSKSQISRMLNKDEK